MKKVLIIILVTVLAAGIILVGVGLILSKGDLGGLFQKDVRTEKSIDEAETVTTLKLDVAADDIELYPSEDGLLHIEYWDSELRPFTYNFSNGTAELRQSTNYINWFQFRIYDNKTMKVYLPETVTETLSIKLASGTLEDKGCLLNIENFRLNLSSGNANIKQSVVTSMDIHMASGNITLQNITANYLNANMSSGDFELRDSEINGILDLDMASGDVRFIDTTAHTLKSDISSGKLNATNFVTESVTSRSASGDITLYIVGNPEDYAVEIDLASGHALIEGEGVSVRSDSDLSWGGGSKNIYCKNSSGDIKIYFINI